MINRKAESYRQGEPLISELSESDDLDSAFFEALWAHVTSEKLLQCLSDGLVVAQSR